MQQKCYIGVNASSSVTCWHQHLHVKGLSEEVAVCGNRGKDIPEVKEDMRQRMLHICGYYSQRVDHGADCKALGA
jgi:hypothetical protein